VDVPQFEFASHLSSRNPAPVEIDIAAYSFRTVRQGLTGASSSIESALKEGGSSFSSSNVLFRSNDSSSLYDLLGASEERES
jgi:hypothetical protein